MDFLNEEIVIPGAHIKYQQALNHNKELLDSLSYAAVVQKGILPQDRHLNRIFKESFVIYKPQNIIGGDLFWVCEKNNLQVFAVGDCTGHGISGAMLSVLAISFLNYLVLGKDLVSLGKVLEELDKKWIETFDQGLNRNYNNDWMEIGICAFNKETRELHFAGAFNKLTYIANGKEYTISGNRYPIGGWQLEKNRSFTDHKIILPPDTMVYLHTDGFKDQFGSNSKKRFGSCRFLNLIKSVSHIPASQQHQTIEEEFHIWKGQEIQTDDMCLMGIRL